MKLVTTVWVCAAWLLVPAVGHAQPTSLPVQGVLSNADGIPLEGNQSVQFRLYDADGGGEVLHDETENVLCEDGVFTHYLSALDMTIFDGQDLWLGIKVGGDNEMTPRLQLGSVPYAGYAKEVASVPTGAVMFFDLAACPGGWSPLAGGAGRTVVGVAPGATIGGSVGASLSDQGSRTITDTPSHLHSVDPDSQSVSIGTAGGHGHNVDPDAYAISSSGSHAHTMGAAGTHDHGLYLEYSGGYGTYGVMGTTNNTGGNYSDAPMGSTGSHSHTVNSTNSSHTHSVDLPAKASTTVAAHSHAGSFNMSAFDSAATGSAAVDVTMPYIQLLICRKD